MGNFDPTGWVSAAAAFMKPSCDIEEEKAEQTLELKYGLKEVTNNAWLGLCGHVHWGTWTMRNSGIGVYAITNKELARTRGIWELAPIGTTGRYYLMEKTHIPNRYLGTMEGPWGLALGHCGASQRRLAGLTTPAEWVKEDSGTEGQFYLKDHLSGTYLGLCGYSSSSSGCPYGASYGVYGMSLCKNTCRYVSDTDCDDGGLGSDYNMCIFGTDCADCGPRPSEREVRGVWTLEIVN